MSRRVKLSQSATVGLFVFLSLGIALSALPRTVAATTTGAYFDHIIIIAMENKDYGSVMGSSSAPFINTLAAAGTTISNYHSYGQNIGGCSAGCYEAFTAGQQHVSDGWCSAGSSPCSSEANIADQLQAAGLSSAMFCEDGCSRAADHFPWIGYSSTWNTCVASSFSCNGQTGPDGNQLYGSSSSDGNSLFINYLNGPSPANYIWFTPSDNHNMHDNSVPTGDSYIQNLLVGTGSLSSPSSNSVFGSSLWTAGHTMFYLWWDEYDPSPNVEYGPMTKVGYTSTGGYDEYDGLHTIEANWGLPYITSVVSGDSVMTDIFASSNPTSLTSSILMSPASPAVNTSITFTASATGGTGSYTYTWSFGDGSTGSGATTTHTYAKVGTYTVAMNATDTTGKTSTKTQQVTVGQASPQDILPGLTPTIAFLIVGTILGGVAGTIAYLARYHSRNRRLREALGKRASP